MDISEGKKYKTRNGLITNPLRKSNNGTSYIFESEIKEPEYQTPSVRAWTGNGSFLTHEIEHILDLIEEICETN